MAKALVIRTAGTNCDAEMVRAFELAGASVELIHLDALIDHPGPLERCDLVGFPGGFSYGDDIASGRIFAIKLRQRLYGALREAARRGVLMIGVCNGFQIMVQAGLLPGPGCEGGQADCTGSPDWPVEPAAPVVSLTQNKDARFVDRWVGMVPNEQSPCVWTQPLVALAVKVSDSADQQAEETADQCASEQPGLMLPVAHGEGRLVCRDQTVLASLRASGQIALRYRENFNGSDDAIAGLCDRSGRIFGLMPHPDRFLSWNRHPYWTRLDKSIIRSQAPGLAMFRAAVDAVSSAGVIS